MTTDTLTTTQYSALAELRQRGALVASSHAFGPAGRTFSSRTLDALVDAGHARYEVVYGVPGAPAVASGIVPIDAPTPVKPTPADTSNYYTSELDHVRVPASEAPHYRLKVTNGLGAETKWLTVTPEVLDTLRGALATLTDN